MKGVRATALCLWACATLAGAQTSDIRQVAREVVDGNPHIQAQRQVVEQLRARLRAARTGYLPSVEGNALVERRRLTIVQGAGDQSFTLGQGDIEARLPLADGGRTAAAVATTRAELENGQAVLDGVVNDTLLDLLTAAADLQRARAIQLHVRQQLDAVRGELDATRRRLQVRDATLTDTAQAEARLASAQATLLDADEEVAASQAQWEAISGKPAPAVIPLVDLPVGPPTLDDAMTRAEQDAPAVRAARSAVDAGNGSVRAARAALAPSVEAVAGYEYLTGGVANLFTGRLPNDRAASYWGVSARIPIFQRGAEYAEISRAKALRGQRQFQAAQAARDAVRDVELAWARRQAATSIVVTARAAVVANESALQGVTREAQLGSRTTLDVLDAQRELLTARITEERATRGQYVARATLLSALGQLQEALLGTKP